MDKIIKPVRLAVLALFITGMSALMMISLYRQQIVEGAAFAAQAKNTISTTTTIPAARGNIFDRYGRAITTNRTCNNLIINDDELFEQPDPNAIILVLANTVLDSGDKYTDTLPITTEAPFEYVDNMTDIQRTLLNAYLDAYDLPASTTAVELMAVFRQKFEIDNNYTSEETRIIAGIRYEIKIRYIYGTADYVFAEDVNIDLIMRLKENAVPGFQVVSSFVREYNTAAAAQILGYVRMMSPEQYKKYSVEGYPLNALVGQDGMELAFESYLHGVDGEAQVTSTKGGTVISTDYITEVQPGNHVISTLDIAMQEVAENSLNSYIASVNAEREEHNAIYEGIPGYEKEIQQLITGGAVVAIEIETGEPLVITSVPTYDIQTFLTDYNSLLTAPNDPLFNRALNGAYPPGSTFKPVTALAALEKGVVTTQTTVYDEGIYMAYADEGYTPKCWIYPYGSHENVNTTRAIEVSCNYYFYTLADMMNYRIIADMAARFGLGEATGIELNESLGHMATAAYMDELEGRPWYDGDTLQQAIGQSISVFTPLQLAVYAATLANNGTRYEASILKGVRSYDYSESLYERDPVVAEQITLPQEYYDAVHLGMYNAANSTANGINNVNTIFGNYRVKVAAKTGTAQLGEGVTNNAIFICYAPYENPEIAIAVVIEKGGSGSAIVSVARDVLDYYFNFKNSATAIETENALLK